MLLKGKKPAHFKWTMDFLVMISTLSKLYLTVIRIIIQSLKSLGKF